MAHLWLANSHHSLRIPCHHQICLWCACPACITHWPCQPCSIMRFPIHPSTKLSTGIWSTTSSLTGKLKKHHPERQDVKVTPTPRTRLLCPLTEAAPLSINKIKSDVCQLRHKVKLFNVNIQAGELKSFCLAWYQFKFQKHNRDSEYGPQRWI